MSDVECIKFLIKNRSKLDKYYMVTEELNCDLAGVADAVIQDLIGLYVDLERLIDLCAFNVKQKFIITKLMQGFSEYDIAKMFNRDRKNIYKHLNYICILIKEKNDYLWKYEYIYATQVKVPWKYKKCALCEEYYPSINEFFMTNNRSKDGLHPICKICR